MAEPTGPMAAGDDVEEAVRGFLSGDIIPPEEAETLDADRDLLSGGVLNSLTLAHLVVFLEERFHLTVEPREFESENFRSLRAITAFVHDKRASR
jgi:acyl carrier protein